MHIALQNLNRINGNEYNIILFEQTRFLLLGKFPRIQDDLFVNMDRLSETTYPNYSGQYKYV